MDLYIGMHGLTNDSRMLRHSSLHYLASYGNLMIFALSVDGHSSYLIGDLNPIVAMVDGPSLVRDQPFRL